MATAHRFFILIRSGAVFRMDLDDDAQTLDTFILKPEGWTESDRLLGYLNQGDVDLEELGPDDAAAYIPAQFRQ